MNERNSSSGAAVSNAAVDDAARAVRRQIALERWFTASQALAFGLRWAAWVVSPALLLVAALGVLLGASGSSSGFVAGDAALIGSLVVVAVVFVVADRAARGLRDRLERRVVTVRAPRPPAPLWRTAGSIVVVVAGIVVVAAWVFVLAALDHGSREAERALRADFETFTPQFLRDRAAAASSPLFAGRGKTHDAGAVLNERVAWTTRTVSAARVSLVKVAPAVASGDFERVTPDEAFGNDCSWMAGLRAFDHWDIDGVALRNTTPYNYVDVFPSFLDVQSWAKARAAQGYVRNDVANASADLHALARLTASEDTLLTTMVALAILHIDLRLIEAERRRHPTADFSWWTPFTRDDDEAIRRSAFASLTFFHDAAPEGSADVIDGSNVFDCMALHEFSGAVHAEKAFFLDVAPARITQTEQLLARARERCLFHGVRDHWNDPPRDDDDGDDDAACSDEARRADPSRCLFLKLGRWVPFSSSLVRRYQTAQCEGPIRCFNGYH